MITPKEIENYCEQHSSAVTEIFGRLNAATLTFAPKVAHMQVGPIEGSFLRFFTKSTQAKRILEFGTFTGCSTLHFAFALPNDGLITTLDRDPDAVAVGRKFWIEAGVSEKIESVIGDARMTSIEIEHAVSKGVRAPYDLAFIDADKGGYAEYFERALGSVRKGGWILVDNVLWSGRVLNPTETSDHVIHEFNQARKSDPRVETLILPIRDGLMICRINDSSCALL